MKSVASTLQQMEENVVNAAIKEVTSDEAPPNLSQPLWKTCSLSSFGTIYFFNILDYNSHNY